MSQRVFWLFGYLPCNFIVDSEFQSVNFVPAHNADPVLPRAEDASLRTEKRLPFSFTNPVWAIVCATSSGSLLHFNMHLMNVLQMQIRFVYSFCIQFVHSSFAALRL